MTVESYVVDSLPPLVVVDAANVVGSIPDGWWADRPGATERLRDALETLSDAGLPAAELPDWTGSPPLEVVLVVEGQARCVRGTAGVRVIAARQSADDTIVELVRDEVPEGRHCLVITSDKELRARVGDLDAEVAGPRTVYP